MKSYRGYKFDPEYRRLVSEGKTKSVAYALVQLRRLGWDGLNHRCRMDVVKTRTTPPLLCPYCGSARSMQLFNISGHYLDDDADYDWCCRSCGMLQYHYFKEPGQSRRLIRERKKTIAAPPISRHLLGRFS